MLTYVLDHVTEDLGISHIFKIRSLPTAISPKVSFVEWGFSLDVL